MIKVRFAPSPTGFLHIGGIRTALINWTFAKSNNGKFLLRIEDTDHIRSNDLYVKSIINTLSWLEITPDESIIFQSANQKIHEQMADKLLKKDLAYWCSCPAKKNNYVNNKNKHRDYCKGPGKNQALRIKTPTSDFISFHDMRRGKMSIKSSEIDDFVILRANNTPVYQFCTPIDDHNMGITHIIRGDDHITNTFAQIIIYNALNLKIPLFTHIPLIHTENGEKLSKRNKAADTIKYRNMGILAEPLKKYLLSLGFDNNKDNLLDDIIKNFDITKINLSPSKLNIEKLININHNYIKFIDTETLLQELNNFYIQISGKNLSDITIQRIKSGNKGLRERSDTLNDILKNANFYLTNKIQPTTADMQKFFNQNAAYKLQNILKEIQIWTEENIKLKLNKLEDLGISKKVGMQSLRIALTGTMQSPSIIEIINALGKEECLQRIANAIKISLS